MLILEFTKENFKRYNNGIGYSITVDTSGNKVCYSVFRTDETSNAKYFPKIIVENHSDDGVYKFEISNWIDISTSDADETIEEMKKYLHGAKIAKASIKEFQKAIADSII